VDQPMFLPAQVAAQEFQANISVKQHNRSKHNFYHVRKRNCFKDPHLPTAEVRTPGFLMVFLPFFPCSDFIFQILTNIFAPIILFHAINVRAHPHVLRSWHIAHRW